MNFVFWSLIRFRSWFFVHKDRTSISSRNTKRHGRAFPCK